MSPKASNAFVVKNCMEAFSFSQSVIAFIYIIKRATNTIVDLGVVHLNLIFIHFDPRVI